MLKNPTSPSSIPAPSPLARLARRAQRPFYVLCFMFLVSTLPGCQLWNNWLDFLKWKDSSPAPSHVAPPPTPTPMIGSERGVPHDVIKLEPGPRVIVYKITVPVGTCSGNEKVWQELNEDVLDSKTSVLIAQNGLRAGSAPQNRWTQVSKLLDVPGARTEQFVCQTDGHSSLNVTTRTSVAEQIVVSIDRDLQQSGRTFENCDNGFRLSMRAVRGKPDLIIQLEPVVTMGTVAVIRAEHELGVTRTGFTVEESFADMRLAAQLTPAQFLVIAAADPKASKFSVGSLWLSETAHVPATETLLVFVPAANPPK
jgi:hypothetical protein